MMGYLTSVRPDESTALDRQPISFQASFMKVFIDILSHREK